MNFTNESKMIYGKFSKWGVRLPMCAENPEQPLTEQRVRQFVAETIERTLDQGNDPIQQAMYSEVHPGFISGSLHPDMTEADLLEWIMETQEMQEALMMFRGSTVQNPDAENSISGWIMDEDEEVGMTDVTQLLLDLTPSDSDWQ